MQKQTVKRIASAAFFLLVFVLTVWAVFHGENLSQIVDYLADANFCYIVPAVACVILFILGESVVIHYLMKTLGNQVKFGHCCLYSFIGFFYSAITPSASGGQPMQVVAMRRDGLPTAASTVVLAIVTITYKLVLVFLGAVVLLTRPDSIMVYLDPVESIIYLGLVLNVIFISLLLIVVFHPTTARHLLSWLFRVVGRIYKFKNPERASARLERLIEQYHGTADFFRENPIIIVRVFFITLIQRMLLFCVIWFTYLAFGLPWHNPVNLIMLYAMISVAADMLPLPGGMGISETLFLTIFEPIFGEALVLPGMVICRGISYYTQLLISAVMTLVSRLILGKSSVKK